MPVGADIDKAPGAMLQLVAFSVRVEKTMLTLLLVTFDTELIVTFRLGR